VHIDKHRVCDVLYTLDPEGMQRMVDDAREVRKEKLEESRNLGVFMRPELFEALSACRTFSSKQHYVLTSTSSQGQSR